MSGRRIGVDPEARENMEKHLARKKPPVFSSTAQTLKWARKLWGDEAVAVSSWWQGHRAEEDKETGGDSAQRDRRPFGVRKDLFGFADAVVLDGNPGLLALQACGADVSEHIRKMAGEVSSRVLPEKLLKAEVDAAKLAGRVRRWLAAGNRLLLVSWRELKVNGKPKRVLRCLLAGPDGWMEIEEIRRESYGTRFISF